MRVSSAGAQLLRGLFLLSAVYACKPKQTSAPPVPATPSGAISDEIPVTPTPPSGQVQLVGCPGHDGFVLKVGEGRVRVTGPMAVARGLTNVPEYHDCQKFIASGAYAAEYAIFADPYLNDLPTSPTAAAALILAGADWSALEIKTGYNCLYLWNPNGNQVKAQMVAVSADADCKKSLSNPSPNLKAKPRKIKNYVNQDDYPHVARWDTDDGNSVYLASIRCDIDKSSGQKERWCEVGPMTGSWNGRKDHNAAGKKTVEVKGYYDEQLLADRNTSGTLAPSNGLANLIPDPDLNTRRDTHYDNAFQQVARVHLNNPVTNYQTEWGFSPGGSSALDDAKTNPIELCHGTAAQCGVDASALKGSCTTTNPADPSDPWWAKIRPYDGASPVFRCVKRNRHAAPLPETGRWAWSYDDESIWIRCPQGCCWIK